MNTHTHTHRHTHTHTHTDTHTHTKCVYIHPQKDGLEEVLVNMTASGCTWVSYACAIPHRDTYLSLLEKQ